MVEPKTRQLYSNEPDAQNSLTKQGDIYVGKLPDNINTANTSLMWNGKNWAMIMLPLSENKNNRINLLAHELFHKAQSALGFTQSNKESNHLDQKDGRIYLRLELEALTKAVLSDSKRTKRASDQCTYLQKIQKFSFSGISYNRKPIGTERRSCGVYRIYDKRKKQSTDKRTFRSDYQCIS